MARLLKADGSVEVVTPAKGTTFTLQELQTFVGGYIEVIRLTGQWLVVNEDGKRLKLPANSRATDLLRDGTGCAPWDFVVGDVLLADYGELD